MWRCALPNFTLVHPSTDCYEIGTERALPQDWFTVRSRFLSISENSLTLFCPCSTGTSVQVTSKSPRSITITRFPHHQAKGKTRREVIGLRLLNPRLRLTVANESSRMRSMFIDSLHLVTSESCCDNSLASLATFSWLLRFSFKDFICENEVKRL